MIRIITMTSVKKISSLVQYFIIGVIAWSFYGVIGLNDFNIFDENNLIENTQAFVLLLVFFLFLVPLFEPFRGDKLIAVFFAILTLAFLLREVDIEKFDLPKILILLGSGNGRNILLALGFLSTLGFALFKFRYYLDLARCFLRNRTGFATLVAGLFLIVGDMFEKIDVPYHVLYEESLELLGYAFLLSAAARLSRKEVKTSRFIG